MSLAVVASELTLGATADEGRGRGGRAITQRPRRSWWLGGLALSKATCVVTVTIVFSPTGCDDSYPERGMCAAKGRLERGLPWEL